MTIDEATIEEIFSNAEERQNFHLIENKPSNRKDLCAFILLDKLFPSNKKIISCSEHDCVYINVSMEELTELTEDDAIYLRRCGLGFDLEHQWLYYFV